MRKQYHLQLLKNGKYNAWDIDKLIECSKDLPVLEIEISQIKELDEPFWYQDDNAIPTCRSISDHIKLVQKADLRFPIIISAEGTVMDGMHRVVKAYNSDFKTIQAVKFQKTPEPDFVEIIPENLPY